MKTIKLFLLMAFITLALKWASIEEHGKPMHLSLVVLILLFLQELFIVSMAVMLCVLFNYFYIKKHRIEF